MDQSFEEMLAKGVDMNKISIVSAIIDRAKEGDPSSLKILSSALEETKFQQEEKISLPADSVKQIIKLAAERL